MKFSTRVFGPNNFSIIFLFNLLHLSDWVTMKTQMECRIMHNVTFHLDIHCLPRQKQPPKKEIRFCWDDTCTSNHSTTLYY